MIALLLIGMLAGENLAPGFGAQKADQVVVAKSERALTLLAGGKVIRTYKVAPRISFLTSKKHAMLRCSVLPPTHR